MSIKYSSLTDQLDYHATDYFARMGRFKVGSIVYLPATPFARWISPARGGYMERRNRVLNTTAASSVNTPGFNVKKSFHKEWKPKKFHYRPPVEPRFNPPKSVKPYRPRVPPSLELSPLETIRASSRSSAGRQRYVARRLAAHQRRLRRFYANEEIRKHSWEKRIADRELQRASYILRYNARLQRYRQRKTRYDAILAKIANGYTVSKWVRNKSRPLPENPYSKTSTIDLGFTGSYVIRQTGRFYPQAGYALMDWVKQGDFDYQCLSESGYLGNSFSDSVAGALTYLEYDTAKLTGIADDAAVSQFYERLSDQKVHIGNMLAERAQTFEMIALNVKRLAAFAASPRRFLASLPMSVSKGSAALSNEFLAFSFGVRPLISDIYGAAESLARLDASIYSDRIIVHATKHVKDSVQDSSLGWFHKDKRLTTCKVRVHYRLEYKITNGTSATLKNLGLLNPAEIAWEVLPWSFVIDWVLPIGNYIQSLTAETGLTFITGSKTVEVETLYQTERAFDANRWWGQNNSWNASGCVTGQKTVKTKVRTLLSAAPGTRLPSFKSPASFQHLLLSLALARQRL